jgi:hypothetical protein
MQRLPQAAILGNRTPYVVLFQKTGKRAQRD